MAAYSPQERTYYDQLFAVIDKDNAGVLPGQDALPFLVTSSLPPQTLGEVWAIADPENNGFLTKDAWYKAARLIGWAQKGGVAVIDDSLTMKAGPYPAFTGHPPPPQQQQQMPLSAQGTGQRPATVPSLPPLTAADRAKFTKIFVGCGPQNGLVSGDKARDVFLKSQLGYDKLGQIWTLADTQQRGSLDLTDFVIGMYLIQSCMANASLSLPSTLPPTVYEQASGGRAPPIAPISRQNTGPASPLRQQYTGGQLQPQRTGPTITAQNTGRSAFAPAATNQQWDITPDAKVASDRFFAQLDTQNRGVIEGDVAVPFMLQSQLDEASLASIWDLADIRKEGKLNKDEFAVAMHLINGKLAGKDVPSVLPNTLIPPSLRGESFPQDSNPGVSSTTRDLFDLFADDPSENLSPQMEPTSPTRAQSNQAFSTAAFLPQPPTRKATAPPPPPAPRALSPSVTGNSMNPYGSGFNAPNYNRAPPSDLLGDDTAAPASAVSDQSVEIGNRQNQLANTERSNVDLDKQKADLEKSAQSSAAELADIEQRLSSAKVKHEAESKAVADLRVRVSEQQTSIKTMNTDLISAESDLSGMRSEKDELEQALLTAKEEVRGLQKRMKEVEDEKTGMKLVLEKLKKEARQQKGMVSIAKKQLTTAEGHRDGLQTDIRAEEASQAALAASPPTETHASPPASESASTIPLPGTPRALSPAATGMSQRSNNPFDRLRNAQSPTLSEHDHQSSSGGLSAALLGAGAVVGVAAGVVVAGASTVIEAAKHAVGSEDPAETTRSQDEGLGATDSEVMPSTANDTRAITAPTVDDMSLSAPHTQTSEVVEEDPFGAADIPTVASRGAVEVDPFGAPSAPAAPSGQFDEQFESSFGDSFANQSVAQSATAAPVQATDFSSDFDDSFGNEPTRSASEPVDQQKSNAAIPVPVAAAESASTREADFESDFNNLDQTAKQGEPLKIDAVSGLDSGFSNFDQAIMNEGIPSGIPKSAIPYLRPDAERTLSTQAMAAGSLPDSPIAAPRDLAHEDVSSDEDDGPEDLDQPSKLRTDTAETPHMPSQIPQSHVPAHASSPVFASSGSPFSNASESEAQQKTRRSAPPPPSAARSPVALAPPIDDFDPFGAPVAQLPQHIQHLPPGAAPAMQSMPSAGNGFDEDDFDFSDLPPAKVDDSHRTPAPAQNFRDDFDFDDEFEKPSTGQGSEASTGMSKSYEMVSPPPSISQHGDFGASNQRQPVNPMPAQNRTFSFDDAFGGDFEPAQSATPASQPHYNAPSGAPPGRSDLLNAPPLPQRRDSEAQADDIEDVKKLCGMGFSRSLVVEALAANSYDFQKTLNVLLQ